MEPDDTAISKCSVMSSNTEIARIQCRWTASPQTGAANVS